MASINLLVRVQSSPAEIYQVLTSNNGIAMWFTETQCEKWRTGAEVKWFDSIDMTISELRENECLRLHVLRGGGWDDTDIQFSLERDTEKTLVRFDHEGWSEPSDHFRDCAMSWAYFLESLRAYLETGVGTPESVAPACESE